MRSKICWLGDNLSKSHVMWTRLTAFTVTNIRNHPLSASCLVCLGYQTVIVDKVFGQREGSVRDGWKCCIYSNSTAIWGSVGILHTEMLSFGIEHPILPSEEDPLFHWATVISVDCKICSGHSPSFGYRLKCVKYKIKFILARAIRTGVFGSCDISSSKRWESNLCPHLIQYKSLVTGIPEWHHKKML